MVPVVRLHVSVQAGDETGEMEKSAGGRRLRDKRTHDILNKMADRETEDRERGREGEGGASFQRQHPWGELIYPQSPGGNEVHECLWGTAAMFLMPASLVPWERSDFLGQGTYSTEGLHLGARSR